MKASKKGGKLSAITSARKAQKTLNALIHLKKQLFLKAAELLTIGLNFSGHCGRMAEISSRKENLACHSLHASARYCEYNEALIF